MPVIELLFWQNTSKLTWNSLNRFVKFSDFKREMLLNYEFHNLQIFGWIMKFQILSNSILVVQSRNSVPIFKWHYRKIYNLFINNVSSDVHLKHQKFLQPIPKVKSVWNSRPQKRWGKFFICVRMNLVLFKLLTCGQLFTF